MPKLETKCPPCPECGTEMGACEDKYICAKCKGFYSQEAWKIKDRQQKVIDEPKQPKLFLPGVTT